MGINIFNYTDCKFKPKINDSFRVSIRWNENEPFEELQTCIGFTVPQPKYKDEYQYYGNQAERYLIPDYESFDDVKLEFYEYDDLRIGQIVSKCLSYNYDFKNNYYINKNIYQILIEILDNNFKNVIYSYDFRYLKLTNYESYELSQEANDPTKWSLSFAYMYFHQGNSATLQSSIPNIITDPDYEFNQTPKTEMNYKKELLDETPNSAIPTTKPSSGTSSKEGGGNDGTGKPTGSTDIGTASPDKVTKNGKSVYEFFAKTDDLVYGWGGKLKNVNDLQDTTVRRGVNESAGATERKADDRDVGSKGIDCLGWVFGAIAYTGGSIEIDGKLYSGQALIKQSSLINTTTFYAKLAKGKIKVNVTKESGITNVFVKEGHIVLQNDQGEIMESAGARDRTGHTGVQRTTISKRKLGNQYAGTGVNVA